MKNKKLPKYEIPQITTYTDADISDDMGLYHANYCCVTSDITITTVP
jgi:hypothetical protein